MANELTALPEFTRTLFKHAYMFLGWFSHTFEDYSLKVDDYDETVRFLEALKEDKPMFFGSFKEMTKANRKLSNFYSSLKPDGDTQANIKALRYFSRAWALAWANRELFDLRGHEVRLMKFFHEIYCKDKVEHLKELQCMARLIDPETVKLARSIHCPDAWTPKKALSHATGEMRKYEKKLFGNDKPLPELCRKVQKRKPKTYAKFQKALRERKEAARLRITELFDENGWFPIIDSATLYEHLRAEGLDDFLPFTYRGRVGVQSTGYPLTFYTYAGLELENPPLNEVVMNMGYGHEEKDKDYKIHPVNDGTFYCETRAMVGESKTKHYTLEYKRRARRLKYDSVNKLSDVIDEVRERMLKHVHSDHRDTWVRALMCLLIDKYCARIGNQASTKGRKKTYGITTLRTAKHVTVTDEEIIIKYKGKHGQDQKHALPRYRTQSEREESLVDSVIADRLIILIKEKREYLFTREDKKPYTPQMVNEYYTSDGPNDEIGLPLGGANSPVTVHTMRNYHATRIFKEYSEDFVKHHQKKKPTYEQVLVAYHGRNKTKTKQGKKGVLDIICKKLGNTPGICRKSYIDPREQLLFFQRWGYRPPDCIIRDLFVHEEHDTYGLRAVLRYERKKVKLAEREQAVSQND